MTIKLLKNLSAISSFIFLVAFPLSALASSLPVLLYHYIGPVPNAHDKFRKELSVSVDNFERQMNFLVANGYEPVTLGYLPYVFGGRLSVSDKKPVLLTFDDGYKDFYFNAFPVLKSHNFHAVSFIPTGLMNQGYYLTWDQIKEIQSSGLVEFESHGVNHISLTQVGSARLEFELSESKRILEKMTGHPVFYLAYPYGTFNSRVAAAARNLGYVGGFTERPKKASVLTLTMPRLKVGGWTSLAEFQNKLK